MKEDCRFIETCAGRRCLTRLLLPLLLGLAIVTAGYATDMEWREVVMRDESGNIYDVPLGELTFRFKSVAFCLGSVLNQARRLMPSRTIRISLHHRARGIQETEYNRLDSEDLIAIVTNQGAPLAEGPVIEDVSGAMFTKAIKQICAAGHLSYSIDTDTDPRVLQIDVGPPELVGMDWTRARYRIDPSQKGGLLGLPRQLDPTGPSMAFDPQTSILVVIDETGNAVFRLLRCLGFQPLAAGPSPTGRPSRKLYE